MHFLAERASARAVGYLAAADAAFSLTMDYVTERKAFGQRVADFQNTRFKMADMRTEIDVAQAFVDQCVIEHNEGSFRPTRGQGQAFTSELENRVMDECVQLHGGAGYMEEYPICRMYPECTRLDDLRGQLRDHARDHRSFDWSRPAQENVESRGDRRPTPPDLQTAASRRYNRRRSSGPGGMSSRGLCRTYR